MRLHGPDGPQLRFVDVLLVQLQRDTRAVREIDAEHHAHASVEEEATNGADALELRFDRACSRAAEQLLAQLGEHRLQTLGDD